MHNDNYHQRVQSLLAPPGKSSWKKQKYSEDGRFDKSNKPFVGASGSEGHGHGNYSLGHKRKLPPQEQKKKVSWIKAKEKLSPAEFQQRNKTGSCINCGEQGHIFGHVQSQSRLNYLWEQWTLKSLFPLL